MTDSCAIELGRFAEQGLAFGSELLPRLGHDEKLVALFVVLRLARQKPAFFRLPPVIGYLLQGIQPEFRMRSIVHACRLGGTLVIGPVVYHGAPQFPPAISLSEFGKQR